MKEKKPQYKVYKFFEPKEITFKFLIKSLEKIGWLSEKKSYEKNMKNTIKINSKTIISNIINFEKDQSIEIEIPIKKIGNQIFGFKVESMSKNRRSIIEIATKIIFSSEVNQNSKKKYLQITKNSFSNNCSSIDSLIRDMLQKHGYNSFF